MDKPYGYVRADMKGLFIYGEDQFTNNLNHDLVPVYTHPKEWVGLTDEEIMEPWPFENRIAFARWLEAKLKEKNT